MKILKKIKSEFHKDGRLEFLYPLYEAIDTFLFRKAVKTTEGAHIRDPYDIKRMMTLVIFALLPSALFGTYNVGYQFFKSSGIDASFIDIILKGITVVLPLYFVVYLSGGLCEILFATIRKHEINEGFFVTGFLIPLILPPTIPLWMAALGTVFGVVLGKEVFGGTGMNIFNPALVSRAFIFFAYPSTMSGNSVWAIHQTKIIDTYTSATPLSLLSNGSANQSFKVLLHDNGYDFFDMFIGLKPGCIGETSSIAILLGAFFLILTGVASWRIMLSVLLGGLLTILSINYIDSNIYPLTVLPFHYHMVMGGFAFGAVFMATDPVSSSATLKGKYIYGFLIGVLAITIRVFNPAYTEGMMMAILFMNIFAPLIDYIFIRNNIKRRRQRAKI